MDPGLLHAGTRQVRRQSDYCKTRTGPLLAYLSREADQQVFTKVPRSYQTSEMFGFSRIAREYASSASRYWLIW
jgi:hypothetical protein